MARSWTRAQIVVFQQKEFERKERLTEARRTRNKTRSKGYNQQFQGCGPQAKLTQEQIKKAVLKGTIPFAVANSGATATYVKPEEEQQ